MRHPVEKTGDERRCPHTMRLFFKAWTRNSPFDTCHHCNNRIPTLRQRMADRGTPLPERRRLL